MKGMQKIKRGTSFSGVLSYALDRDDKKQPGWVVGGNIEGHSTSDIVQQFQTTADMRPDIEKPVWHQSLRLPKGEHLSDEKWTEVADDYMKRMGFKQQNPRIYIQHNDKAGEHIHIIASRVSMLGELYYGQNENLKSTRIIQDLEIKHGLTQTKSVDIDQDGKTIMPDKTKIKKNEREMAIREQELPPRRNIQIEIDKTIARISHNQQFTASALAEKLEENGVKVNPNISKTGTFNGFSFAMDDQFFKGSQLGKTYTKKGLSERGMTYDIKNDADILREYKAKNKDMWNDSISDDDTQEICNIQKFDKYVPPKTYNIQEFDNDILTKLIEANKNDYGDDYRTNITARIKKAEERIKLNDAVIERYNSAPDDTRDGYKNTYPTLSEQGIVSKLCENEHKNHNVSRDSNDLSVGGSTPRNEEYRKQNEKLNLMLDYLEADAIIVKNTKTVNTQQQEETKKSRVRITF